MLKPASRKAYQAARPRQAALVRIMLPILGVLCLLPFFTSRAGLGDAVIKQGEKGTQALFETANIVENVRCNFRVVGVLAKMIEERGPEWAAGYMLSCKNLKPLMDAAKTVPELRVE